MIKTQYVLLIQRVLKKIFYYDNISRVFIWLARPNNIWSFAVNEKIYIFLWFWFLLLGFLTILVVFYRILIVFSPRIRVTTYQCRFVPQFLFHFAWYLFRQGLNLNFPGVPSVYPVPACKERVHQHYHQEDKDGRLVPALHARTQHWLDHLQGGGARARQEAGLSQQGHLRVLRGQAEALVTEEIGR